MPLSRAQKHDIVSRYEEDLASAPSAFVVGYKGISVPQVTDLRAKIRNSGGKYLVVKNTLALRAIDGKPLAGLKELFAGPTAVVFGEGDPVALAKVLTDFAKTVPAIEFKGALVDGQAVAAAQIQEIADLPSREALIAKLLFLMQSPVSRFVRGLAAIEQQFVSVLDQIRAQKEENA
jgi:large subunit ribosomal protein L10